eukprot:CAMPEP_0201591646 /NCGR_PEP_ID=MMETSP0190_2-20130828/189759_1 /ASSEMBLY_ACC=CAM_ASM_000263 /TAXON_ID=37353 /ORGANISM="Rosalina sp." /LENGTH=644 /DNA_ID=CAMNT_0048050061 /DNA_START=34 /DNA_END=1966 /DNA_ORIENTATION=-
MVILSTIILFIQLAASCDDTDESVQCIAATAGDGTSWPPNNQFFAAAPNNQGNGGTPLWDITLQEEDESTKFSFGQNALGPFRGGDADDSENERTTITKDFACRYASKVNVKYILYSCGDLEAVGENADSFQMKLNGVSQQDTEIQIANDKTIEESEEVDKDESGILEMLSDHCEPWRSLIYDFTTNELDVAANKRFSVEFDAQQSSVAEYFAIGNVSVRCIANDRDGDKVPDTIDNCRDVANPYQKDYDHDDKENNIKKKFACRYASKVNVKYILYSCGDLEPKGASGEDSFQMSLGGTVQQGTVIEIDEDEELVVGSEEVDEPEILDGLSHCPEAQPEWRSRLFDFDTNELDVAANVPFSVEFDASLSATREYFAIGDVQVRCIANDKDKDGRPDRIDNCPDVANPYQKEAIGNVQVKCIAKDEDKDGKADTIDNCPKVFNPYQKDLDHDGDGDKCDYDIDGDYIPNKYDYCPYKPGSYYNKGCPPEDKQYGKGGRGDEGKGQGGYRYDTGNRDGGKGDKGYSYGGGNGGGYDGNNNKDDKGQGINNMVKVGEVMKEKDKEDIDMTQVIEMVEKVIKDKEEMEVDMGMTEVIEMMVEEEEEVEVDQDQDQIQDRIHHQIAVQEEVDQETDMKEMIKMKEKKW